MSWQPLINTGAVWIAIAFLFLQWAEGENFDFWLERSHTELCERQLRLHGALVSVINAAEETAPEIKSYAASMGSALKGTHCPPIAPPSKALSDAFRLMWYGPEEDWGDLALEHRLEGHEAGP